MQQPPRLWRTKSLPLKTDQHTYSQSKPNLPTPFTTSSVFPSSLNNPLYKTTLSPITLLPHQNCSCTTTTTNYTSPQQKTAASHGDVNEKQHFDQPLLLPSCLSPPLCLSTSSAVKCRNSQLRIYCMYKKKFDSFCICFVLITGKFTRIIVTLLIYIVNCLALELL